MADAPAAPAPAASTPAPAPAAGDKPPEKPSGPAMTASEAGKTLRQIRDAHMQDLRDRQKAKEGEKPATPAPEKPAEAAPEAKKETTDADDDLAALMAEDRRLKTAAKDLETKAAALKDVEEAAPVIRQAREHLKKGELLPAVKVVFGEKAMKDLLWELLKENPEAKDGEGAAPDVDKLLDAKLEARAQAEKDKRDQEAAEARQKADQRLAEVDRTAQQPGFAAAVAAIPSLKGIDPDTIEAFGKYAASAASYFKEHKAEFRAVDRYGVTSLQLVEKAESMRIERLKADPRATPPSLAEVLKALDDDLLAHARELAGAPAPGAKPPIPTYSSAFQQQAGTPAPAEGRHLTLEERREKHRQALRDRRTA